MKKELYEEIIRANSKSLRNNNPYLVDKEINEEEVENTEENEENEENNSNKKKKTHQYVCSTLDLGDHNIGLFEQIDSGKSKDLFVVTLLMVLALEKEILLGLEKIYY